MRSRRQSGVYLWTKRAIDLLGAAAVTVLLSPLLFAIAVAVKLDSKGPALYRARRLGRDQQEITVYKFRTMFHGVDDGPHREYVQRMLSAPSAEAVTAGMFKLTEDERVTRRGRTLRRWSLDELPQLLNVIKGNMSLVGPRPEVPYALEGYRPEDHRRFEVLPGMTGLWQVEGRANLSPREMLELDSRYARTCSLMMDLKLLIRTVPAVLARVGSA